MALATVSGNLRDFTGAVVTGARMWAHPLRGGHSSAFALVDRPTEVPVSPTGAFTVSLEELYTYRMEVVYPDRERDRMGWTTLQDFKVPVGGGPLNILIGLPVQNGMVRVIDGTPYGSLFDQYVYDETTGDLYERTS